MYIQFYCFPNFCFEIEAVVLNVLVPGHHLPFAEYPYILLIFCLLAFSNFPFYFVDNMLVLIVRIPSHYLLSFFLLSNNTVFNPKQCCLIFVQRKMIS